ncbi:MAG: PrkA family serine protein kinase, partial [Myxococcales bacterium]
MQTFRESDTGLVSRIAALQDKTSFKELHWEGSFEDYLRIVRENPRVTRTAFQRIYDMILSHGKTEYIDNKKKLIRYHFFHDEKFGGRDAVYGLDVPLMKLVNVFKSAAQGYGTEKRVILLHGPVGSAKSTIVRLLKKGTEEYSRTPDGALYTFSWKLDKKNGDGTTVQQDYQTPMNEDPLLLIPEEWREKVFADLCPPEAGFKIPVGGDLCPASRLIFRELMAEYKGEFAKVIQHVRVKRLLLSEKDRIGIGTFQPKDEKNQDSTELTGDLNYRKIAEYGSDSDPRAFNFDGELNIANRGLIEFIEILKLDVAFLYDLLGASQEHKIKPKKFPQTDIDEVLVGHTNEPEYRKLQNNELMEAFRDRTVKIDVPYNTVWQEEVKIYARDFNDRQITGKHIAPHTIEMSAIWAVLTRLEEPKKAQITLIQKMKLYGGKTLPGFTEDNVKEFHEESPREGMEGISPRYIQDKISNALVSHQAQLEKAINPFMVMNELEGGLTHHSLITDEELKKEYKELLAVVREEYEDILKGEVQRAISADEDAIKRLAANYI